MRRISILLSVSLVCFACTNKQSEAIGILDSIHIPDNVLLDVDQDGEIDFTVTYIRRTEGDPAGNYEVVRMNLESEHNHQVLKSNNEQPIFLNDINSIQLEVEQPLYWEVTNPSSNIVFPIARIRTDYDQMQWNDEWTIFSLEERASYLIGIKLIGNSVTQLGLIEFSVDTQTGEFILLRTELF